MPHALPNDIEGYKSFDKNNVIFMLEVCCLVIFPYFLLLRIISHECMRCYEVALFFNVGFIHPIFVHIMDYSTLS